MPVDNDSELFLEWFEPRREGVSAKCLREVMEMDDDRRLRNSD